MKTRPPLNGLTPRTMQETARDPWDWWEHADLELDTDRRDLKAADAIAALLGAAIAVLILSTLYWCLI